MVRKLQQFGFLCTLLSLCSANTVELISRSMPTQTSSIILAHPIRITGQIALPTPFAPDIFAPTLDEELRRRQATCNLDEIECSDGCCPIGYFCTSTVANGMNVGACGGTECAPGAVTCPSPFEACCADADATCNAAGSCEAGSGGGGSAPLTAGVDPGSVSDAYASYVSAASGAYGTYLSSYNAYTSSQKAAYSSYYSASNSYDAATSSYAAYTKSYYDNFSSKEQSYSESVREASLSASLDAIQSSLEALSSNRSGNQGRASMMIDSRASGAIAVAFALGVGAAAIFL